MGTLWTQRSTSLPPSTSTLTLSICSSTFFRSSERLEINIGNWFKLNVLVFLVMGGALRLHKNISQVLHCSKKGPFYKDRVPKKGPFWRFGSPIGSLFLEQLYYRRRYLYVLYISALM